MGEGGRRWKAQRALTFSYSSMAALSSSSVTSKLERLKGSAKSERERERERELDFSIPHDCERERDGRMGTVVRGRVLTLDETTRLPSWLGLLALLSLTARTNRRTFEPAPK